MRQANGQFGTGNKMSLRRKALQVKCPACNAEPHRNCMFGGNWTFTSFHKERLKAARQAVLTAGQ